MVSSPRKGTFGSGDLKILTRLEELAFVLFSIYLFTRLQFAWWVYPVFFFTPDLSLVGLLAGKRAGALTYNLIHHKAVALGAYVGGSIMGFPILSLVGVILLGHSSLDRVLGFGLFETAPSSPARAISPGD